MTPSLSALLIAKDEERDLPGCLQSLKGLATEIEVDGNVSWTNIPKMIEAGADILVLGTSALFEKHRSRKESLSDLRKLLGR